MRFSFAFRSLLLTVVVASAACGRDEEPKLPLGHPPIGEDQPMQPTITGEARVALDSANALFRSRAYDQALAQYRRSAELAPREMAPLLGIMMVADATNDARLRESTMAAMRALDPTMTETEAMGGHSRAVERHEQATGGAAKQ
jgi:hypothetical protein